MYRRIIKPVLDFLISFFGALILSPLFLFLIIAIKIDSRGPVLFKQNRVGKNKKLFKIWKFRTMKIDTPKDVPTHMLENPEQYITRVGKILRKTSLDELPQIFNILGGKMSVIGPRPALWNQEDLIAEREKYGANSIRPGLTGWAQINGRDELPIEVKANYDGQYIQRMGFLFDIKVFFKTIFSVLKKEGVREGKATAENKTENCTEIKNETTESEKTEITTEMIQDNNESFTENIKNEGTSEKKD